MSVTRSFGTQVRLRRLSRHGDGRLLVVPLDHSVSDGPIDATGDLSPLVARIVAGGADAVVLHRGSMRNLDPRVLNNVALVVHLSASTVHAPDPDAKYLVASVEGALRTGADAVSVHVNLGSAEEAQQIADLAVVAEACDRWNVPLLAMMYPRGPRITNPRDAGLIAHAATLAADLGADLVKVPYAHHAEAMAEAVRASPIPVLVAGGPRLNSVDDLRRHAGEVMRSGAAGLAVGRNVFAAPDPEQRTRIVAGIVHGASVPAGPIRELAAVVPSPRP